MTCEVTPHHLLLTDSAVIGYDTACKVNPPLREPEDVEALRTGVLDGTIDAIVTDHAPHSSLEKDCEFSEAAPGMIGLELSLALMLGHFGTDAARLARLVEVMSSRPAAIVGLTPPSIAEGAIAELVLVDPSQQWTPETGNLRSKSRNTPFLRQPLTGRALWTMANGHVVHDSLSEVRPGGPC